MFNHNYLLEKLRSGSSVIGTWSIIPSPVVVDILCASGLDFIIIDSEHGPVNFETAQEMVMVCESRSVSPIMRLGGVSEPDILRALDIGVHGIQIPNINWKSEVEQLVKYAKYPPLGNRGFSPFTRAGNYSFENATTLSEKANSNTLIGINVEGIEALNNIESILSVPELDIVFIGLFDISKALGIPGEIRDSKVQRYLKELTNKINNAGKFPGTIATDIESLIKYKDLGIKYLLYLVDCEMLRNSYNEVKLHFDKEIQK